MLENRTNRVSRLKRPIHPMPDFVKEALIERNLMDAYHRRPAYQQNDYISWITLAKRRETKEKRLAMMLAELAAGEGYMGLKYNARGNK